MPNFALWGEVINEVMQHRTRKRAPERRQKMKQTSECTAPRKSYREKVKGIRMRKIWQVYVYCIPTVYITVGSSLAEDSLILWEIRFPSFPPGRQHCSFNEEIVN